MGPMAGTYTTKAGDMWDSISYELYGDEFRMTELMRANPEQLGTVVFGDGVELVVPEIEAPVADTLPPWKRS